MSIEEKDVLKALSSVMDPDLNLDIVTAGMVKGIKILGADVSLQIELTTPACPMKEKIKTDVENALKAMSGVGAVSIDMTSKVRPAPLGVSQTVLLPGVKNVLMVGAGKGGVGKSTLALNLACALVHHGAQVGLLDADIYGPSIAVMTGITSKPVSLDGRTLEPLEVYGLKVMSIGFLIEADQALIWRGPMIHGALMQLVRDVNWGPLDYLVLDLPPGTGDVPLTVAQQVPSSGAVLVTTPQDLALADVMRAKQMFHKLNVPLLGIVENMSYFTCPHCAKDIDIFHRGGGRRAASAMGMTFLGEIPLDLKIRIGGDEGVPLMGNPSESPEAKAFMGIASQVAARISQENALRKRS